MGVSMPDTGPVRADRLVLYGITGDLAKKLVLPALYRLTVARELTVPIVGVALTDWDRDTLLRHLRASVLAAEGAVDEAAFAALAARTSLVAGDFADPATFDRLRAEVAGARFLAHYLAVPPSLFGLVTAGIAAAGLNRDARLVVEKPFGRDAASARALDDQLHRAFAEDRLFRVDHYLGKEPVEDLTVFRFANTVLEPVWNRNYVRQVQLTMAESFDVSDRGAFYDGVGTLRDVVQNHLLQVLAYTLMEPPVSDDADAQRDEKVKLLRSVRTPRPADLVRGRYDGYLDTPGVAPGSSTETYAALRLHVDNWRWADVPVLLRAGKCLPRTVLEIVVEFRRPPTRLFRGATSARPQRNLLRLRLQPEPALTFELQAKQPGRDRTRTVDVTVDFTRSLGRMAEAYERILADAVSGDPRHFARRDTVAQAWRIVDPLVDRTDEPLPYPRDSWGPAEADALPPAGRWLPPAPG